MVTVSTNQWLPHLRLLQLPMQYLMDAITIFFHGGGTSLAVLWTAIGKTSLLDCIL